jgi:hypothetical protein
MIPPHITIWTSAARLAEAASAADAADRHVFRDLVYPCAADVHMAPRHPSGLLVCGTLALIVVVSQPLLAWLGAYDPAMLKSGFVECIPCLCSRGKVALPLYAWASIPGAPAPRDFRLSIYTAEAKRELAESGRIRHVLMSENT